MSCSESGFNNLLFEFINWLSYRSGSTAISQTSPTKIDSSSSAYLPIHLEPRYFRSADYFSASMIATLS